MSPPQTRVVEDARFGRAAAYSAEHGGHLLLVQSGGEVLFESGQNGFDPAAPHPLFDATSAFWGVAAVVAQHDGLIDLDEPVARTLPTFDTDRWRRAIAPRHLLHATSGIVGGALAIAEAEDRTARAMDLSMVAAPGDGHQFGPSHTFVFAEWFGRKLRASGQSLEPVAWLEQRILDPIGAAVARWDRDPAGNFDPAAGAHLTARGWARFGLLLEGRGRVGGEEIAPAATFAPVFEGSSANPTQGLGVWLNAEQPDGLDWRSGSGRRAFHPDGLPDLVLAAGQGGQRLYVIPSLSLVVVRFASGDRSFRDETFLRHLVAGLEGDRPPSGSEAENTSVSGWNAAQANQ